MAYGNYKTQQLLLIYCGAFAFTVLLILVLRRTSVSNSADLRSKAHRPRRPKYHAIDFLSEAGMTLKYGLMIALVLSLKTISWTVWDEPTAYTLDDIVIDTDFEIVPPPTAPKPPPLPPPVEIESPP